jgi:hypothetical protein
MPEVESVSLPQAEINKAKLNAATAKNVFFIVFD